MAGMLDWTLTVGAVAVPLTNHSIRSTGVVVQSSPNNAGNVFVGDAGSQSVQLAAGDSETIPIDGPQKVWVRGSIAGQIVNVHVTDEGRRK